MVASDGKVIFDGSGRDLEDGGDVFDAAVLEVVESDHRLLLFRQPVQGLVETLMSERCVSLFCGRDIQRLRRVRG